MSFMVMQNLYRRVSWYSNDDDRTAAGFFSSLATRLWGKRIGQQMLGRIDSPKEHAQCCGAIPSVTLSE